MTETYEIVEETLRNGIRRFYLKEVCGTSRYTISSYSTLEEAEKRAEELLGYQVVSERVVQTFPPQPSSPSETSPLQQGSWLRRLVGLTH